MAKKTAKPKGWKAFDRLAKKLVGVPKDTARKKPKRKKKRSK